MLTIPNLISFVRLLGVPLFLYLFLVEEHIAAAVIVLAVGGTSDWVDGYAARALGQVSRLGQMLDPMADRLYIFATVLAFTLREVVPWQFTVALILRELVLGAALPVLRAYGYGPPPVHYLGKTATFVLLVAFPCLLVGQLDGLAGAIGDPVGWSLALWGLALYWCAAGLYILHARQLIRQARRGHGAGA